MRKSILFSFFQSHEHINSVNATKEIEPFSKTKQSIWLSCPPRTGAVPWADGKGPHRAVTIGHKLKCLSIRKCLFIKPKCFTKLGWFCRSCCSMKAIFPCTCLVTQPPSHPGDHPSTATGDLPWASRLSTSLQFARTSNGGLRMRSGSSTAVGSGIHCLSVSHHESFPQHQRLYLVTKYIKHNRIRSYRLNWTKSDYNSRERS